MRAGRRCLCCLLLIGLGGCQQASIERAMRTITPAALQAHIQFLSSDQLGGRAPGTRGARLAADYMASQLELAGLNGATPDGGYRQAVPLIAAVPAPTLSFRARGGARYRPVHVEDYVAWSGRPEPTTTASGELLFVGHGITAPEFAWDDYEGADVEGRTVLILAGDPGQAVTDRFRSDTLTYYGTWTYKLDEAARRGASGALLIHDEGSAGYAWHVVASSRTGEIFYLDGVGRDSDRLAYQGWLSEETAEQVLSIAGLDYETVIEAARSPAFRPVSTGITVSASIDNQVRSFPDHNVVGLLPGSDPEASREIVVVTAHYDGLGTGLPVAGDSIYNGAYDNASGAASLLVLADAFARLPQRPRRSLLFLATTAKEAGLLGSRYYVENPLRPLDRTVANINLDGVNVWGRTRDVIVLGAPLSSLSAHVIAAAEAEELILRGDPAPRQGRLYRSDQFSFLDAGVPIAFIEPGYDFVGRMPGWGMATRQSYIARDYHQPSDEYDPEIDLSGAVQQTRVAFRVILAVANAPERPRWTDLATLMTLVDSASNGVGNRTD